MTAFPFWKDSTGLAVCTYSLLPSIPFGRLLLFSSILNACCAY